MVNEETKNPASDRGLGAIDARIALVADERLQKRLRELREDHPDASFYELYVMTGRG